MFKIAIGTSQDSDPAQAIGDAVAQGLAGLENGEAQAGILFNSGHDADGTLLNAIHDVWPQIKLMGCAGHSAELGAEKSLRLFLFHSPDLLFHLSRPSQHGGSAELAAERALADFMHEAASLALYLGLGDEGDRWYHDFEQALGRLLPSNCANLSPLLPPVEMPAGPLRYYMGQQVVSDTSPVLLARHRNKETSGWRFTRQPGILRKQQNDAVYVYDTLIGERRRMPAA